MTLFCNNIIGGSTVLTQVATSAKKIRTLKKFRSIVRSSIGLYCSHTLVRQYIFNSTSISTQLLQRTIHLKFTEMPREKPIIPHGMPNPIGKPVIEGVRTLTRIGGEQPTTYLRVIKLQQFSLCQVGIPYTYDNLDYPGGSFGKILIYYSTFMHKQLLTFFFPRKFAQRPVSLGLENSPSGWTWKSKVGDPCSMADAVRHIGPRPGV